uniref:Uncharacterized protein n=1 Tax=Arundo donax TaxID=35708 RepID=A0A0A9HFK2_ARUDO
MFDLCVPDKELWSLPKIV